MPALARDLELSPKDHELLRSVWSGQERASIAALERFHPVMLAFIFRHTKDFHEATRVVDGLARQLFSELMNGQLAPDRFAHEIDARSAAVAAARNDGRDAMHSVWKSTKLVRRRAVAEAATQLPVDQLTALVLYYHSAWSFDQMVGIVAEDRQAVQQAVVTAHRAIVESMNGLSEMDCAKFQAELPITLIDESDDEARDAFVKHAAGCPACRRLLQQWQEVQRALENLLGATKTDPQLVFAPARRTFIEDLEDALLRVTPAGGGIIGAMMGANLLGPPSGVAFTAGFAIGGIMVYAMIYCLFCCLNPKRNRRKKK